MENNLSGAHAQKCWQNHIKASQIGFPCMNKWKSEAFVDYFPCFQCWMEQNIH